MAAFVLSLAIKTASQKRLRKKGEFRMGVSVGTLDHFNIRTRNLSDTVRFYEDILGLEKGPRPNFAFPGAWMYSEGKAVVRSEERRVGKECRSRWSPHH